MTRFRTQNILLVVALLTVPVALAQGQASGQPALARVEPATFGEPFPAHTFNNLNPGAGGGEMIDIGKVLGKKPVVLCYWIALNKRAEEILLETQELVEEAGPDKVQLYAVATPRPGLGEKEIRERAEAIGVKVPVLSDEGFRIGQQLVVQAVPHITLIDREGRLRLANGGSLLQTLEYKIDLAAAIRRLASTGSVGTYGYLPRYNPAKEMVGKMSPDFQAPDAADGVVQRWHDLMKSDKVNILVFWSVDCPHCRKQLPEIDRWFKANSDGFVLVTAAGVTDDTSKAKTREFTKLSGFSFRTLLDEQRQVGSEYNVTSTPTIFIVRPDGVIDTVILTGTTDFVRTFEAKKRELLASGT